MVRLVRPALLMAFVSLALVPGPGMVRNVSEEYLAAAANAEREAAGLKPLHRDLMLEEAAFSHARAMAAHGTISHQFSGEADLASRAGAAGARFSLITENVAEASNSALIHDLWMNSAGHRANLLDAQVDAIGVAVVSEHGQLYAVEDFARSVHALSAEEQEALVARLLERSGILVSGGTYEARQTCAMKSGYAGSRQPWFVMRYTSGSLDRLPDQLTERLARGKYHSATVGACTVRATLPFSSYNIAVLLYP